MSEFVITEHEFFYDPDEPYTMLSGYGLSLKQLANAYQKNNRNSLIFPILFLLRHYIELSIKMIFIKYKELVDEKFDIKNLAGHGLIRDELTELVEWVKGNFGEEIPNIVIEVIKILHDTDKKGDYFRYPCDIKGNKYRDKLIQVDPILLQNSVGEVTDFFKGFYLWVDELIEQKQDMESEYQDSNNEF